MKTVALALKHTSLALLLLGSSMWMAGCGDDDGGECSVLSVSGGPKVGVGKTISYTATCIKSDKTMVDVSTDSSTVWESADTAIATVAAGQATGVAAGQTTIKATYKGSSGEAPIEVVELVANELQVTPAAASIAVNGEQQFTAKVFYSDGSTEDVSTSAAWTSSDEAIATVEAATGKATGKAIGEATITATYQGKTGTATLTVTNKRVTSIAVAPATAEINKGLTQAFTATATYDDSTTGDVTTLVTWRSADDTIATISNSSGSEGVATGVKVGTVKISATLGTIEGEADLTVKAAELDHIEITPASPIEVFLNGTQRLTATAIYKDGSNANVTKEASWTSSDAAKVEVNNDSANGGENKGVISGKAVTEVNAPVTITASFGGMEGTAAVKVVRLVPALVTVTPNPLTLARGTSQNLVATATMTDGTQVNVSDSPDCSWQSADPSKVTVDGKHVTGVDVTTGGVTVTATFLGVQGTAVVNVTNAQLTSITIAPATSQSVPKGQHVVFVATGHFSDGTTQNISADANWLSSQAGIVTFADATGLNGRPEEWATGAALGTTTVTATSPNGAITSNAVTVTVTEAQLTSIAITPVAPNALQIGGAQQFTAIGNYSDGTHPPLTDAVTWYSSIPSKASISNATGTKGVASALVGGTTEIFAKLGSIESNRVPLRVLAAETQLSYITLQPDTLSLQRGETGVIVVLGHFFDPATGGMYISNISNQVATSLLVIDNAGNPITHFTVTKAVADVSGGDRLIVNGVLSTAALAEGNGYPAGQGLLRVFQGSIESYAQIKVTDTEITGIAVTCRGPLNCAPSNFDPENPFGVYSTLCKATATYRDGTTGNVTASASWESSNTEVATIGSLDYYAEEMVVNVIGDGTAVITAQVGEIISPNTNVPNATITGAPMTLSGITVTPATQSMRSGSLIQYTATGRFTGTGACAGPIDVDVTRHVEWSAAFTSVAIPWGAPGLFMTMAPGSTAITATFYPNYSNAANLTVTDKCVSAVRIIGAAGNCYSPVWGGGGGGVIDSPFIPQFDFLCTTPANVTAPLSVLAIYGNDAYPDIEPLEPGTLGTWSSAAVNSHTWGLNVGTTDPGVLTFTVSQNTCDGNPVSDWITMKVDSEAQLSHLYLEPTENVLMQRGDAQDFLAWATFVGYSWDFNVSAHSQWGHAPVIANLGHAAAPATADALPAERFQHTGTAEGSTAVYAVYRTMTAWRGLEITGEEVDHIELTVAPALPAAGAPVGVLLNFQAKVFFQDGSTTVNPGPAIFSSDNASKLAPAGGTYADNMFLTVAPSAGTNPKVTASYGGKTSNAVSVLINTAEADDITFNPMSPLTMQKQTRRPLTVTAHFNNGTSFDISTVVGSVTSDNSYVDVQTTSNGTTVSSTNLATTDPILLTFTYQGITKYYNVSVNGSCYTGISITALTDPIGIGATGDFRAFATPSDGTAVVPVTASCQWSPTNAYLSNEGQVGAGATISRRYKGLAATAPGQTTVSCTLAGATVCEGGNLMDTSMEATKDVTVSGAHVTAIRITPTPVGTETARKVPLQEHLQLHAFVDLSDGTRNLEVTDNAGTTWTVAGGFVAVSDTAPTKGYLTAGASVGTALVSVNYGGMTATLNVAVQNCGAPVITITTTGVGKLPFTDSFAATREYTATATYPDPPDDNCTADAVSERTIDVTKVALWELVDKSVADMASIGNGSLIGGIVTAGPLAGTGNVRATHMGITSGVLNLETIHAELTGLSVAPVGPINLPLGDGAGSGVKLTVSATYTAGTETFTNLEPPPAITWQQLHATDGVLSFDGPLPGTSNREYTLRGHVLRNNTSFYGEVDLGGGDKVSTNTVLVNVVAACVANIAFDTPASDPTWPRGLPFILRAVCHDTTGAATTCTPVYSKDGVAIDDFAGKLASGIARVAPTAVPGSTSKVIATVTGCNGTPKTAERIVTVGSATLQGIRNLTPSIHSAPMGVKLQYSLEGVYVDGTGAGIWDVTAGTTFTSTNTLVATSDNDNTGHVTTTYVEGTTLIIAAFGGYTSQLPPTTPPDPTKAYHGQLMVSGKLPVSMVIVADQNLVGGAAGSATMPRGGYLLPLRCQVTWSDTTVSFAPADFCNFTLSGTLVGNTSIINSGVYGILTTSTTAAGGTQEVTATSTDGSAIVAKFNVNIVNEDLAGLYIVNSEGGTPTNRVPKGLTVNYGAQAQLRNGTQRYWVTNSVEWTSSVDSRGTVDSGWPNGGLFHASPVNTGVTNVSIHMGASGMTGDLAVTVTDAVPVGLYCSPSEMMLLNPGDKGLLHAWLQLSDDTFAEVTFDEHTSWQSSAPNIAEFLGSDPAGVITGHAEGWTAVRPTYTPAAGAPIVAPDDHRCVVYVGVPLT